MTKYLFAAAILMVVCASRAVDLKLIPQGTKWITEVDLKTLGESETGRYLKQKAAAGVPGEKQVRSFAEQTGIDFARDVASFAFCGSGTGRNAGFMILKGAWNVDTVAATLPKAKNFVTKEYGKHVVMSWEDRGPRFACLVDNKLAFFASDEAQLLLALDTRDGRKPHAANDAAFANFNPVAKKPFLILRARDVGAMAANNPRAAALQQTESISCLIEEAPASAGVAVDLALTALSAEAATQIATMLQGMQAMAQMQGANNADLLDLTKAFKIASAGKKVSLNAVLQKELVKRLMDSVARVGSGNAAQGWPAPAVPPAFE